MKLPKKRDPKKKAADKAAKKQQRAAKKTARKTERQTKKTDRKLSKTQKKGKPTKKQPAKKMTKVEIAKPKPKKGAATSTAAKPTKISKKAPAKPVKKATIIKTADQPDIIKSVSGAAGSKLTGKISGTRGPVSVTQLGPKVPPKQKGNVTPVLMMPVRIETKFKRIGKGASDYRMRLRIYPDNISVNGHDPRLTKEEVELGTRFWEASKKKTGEKSDRLSDWRTLATQIDPRRAIYILKQTQGGQAKPQRNADAILPAHAALLPARWIVRGYIGPFKVFEKQSTRVRNGLKVSPDPAHFDGNRVNPDSPIGWMFDFGKAVEAGMAIQSDLSTDLQTGSPMFRQLSGFKGFDRLVVYGVPRSADGTNELERLFEAKSYTEGAMFVPQGTPTNNSERFESGWTEFEDDPDRLFAEAFPKLVQEQETSPPRPDSLSMSVGNYRSFDNFSVIKKALGLTQSSVCENWEYGRAQENKLQSLMNKTVWPIGWGRYFKDLLRGEKSDFFSPTQRNWLQRFFTNDMRGGATIPAIAFGDNPYGIALTAPNLDTVVNGREETAIAGLIKKVKYHWVNAGNDIEKITDGENEGDPGMALTRLLARVPDPASFSLRQLYDREWGLEFVYELLRYGFFNLHEGAKRINEITKIFAPEGQGQPDQVDNLAAQRAIFEHSYNFLKPLDIRYVEVKGRMAAWRDPIRLSNGQRIDRNRPNITDISRLLAIVIGPKYRGVMKPYARKLPKEKYMDDFVAIAEVLITCEKIFEHLDEHEARNEVFKAVGAPAGLFKGPMGPGHNDPVISYGLYGAESARDWPVEELLTISKGQNIIGHEVYLSYLAGYGRSRVSGETAPAHPYANAERMPLCYYLFKSAIDISYSEAKAADPDNKKPEDPAHRRLDDILKALDIFAPMEKGALELLLRQSLGLNGLRLDALATGLMKRGLDRTRAKKSTPTGIRVGAYGYVEDVRPQGSDGRSRVDESFIHTPSITHAKTAAILRAGWRSRGSSGDAHAPLAVDLSSSRMKWAKWCNSAIAEGADLGDLLGARVERILADKKLQVLIDPLRRAVLSLSGEQLELDAPVVDGLDLIALWDNGNGGTAIANAMIYADSTKAAKPARVFPAIREIAGIVDAMADAAVADATFSLVQGNPTKAGASLAAISDGSASPSDLAVLETPGTGPVMTNSVALMVDPDLMIDWPPVKNNQRALCDPSGERLARQVIGLPESIRFRSSSDKEIFEFTLQDFLLDCEGGLSALDIISMLNSGAGGSELVRRLDQYIANNSTNSESSTPGQLDRGDGYLLLLQSWQDVFTHSRGLSVSDFADQYAELDDSKLAVVEAHEQRELGLILKSLKSAVNDFAKHLKRLEKAMPVAAGEDPEPIDPELDVAAVETISTRIAALAVFNNWSLENKKDSNCERVQRRAWATLKAMRKRLTDIRKIIGALDPDQDISQSWKVTRKVADQLFGKGLALAMPLPTEILALITPAVKDGSEKLARHERTPFSWLSDMGKVKPPLRLISDAMMMNEAMSRPRLNIHMAQLPTDAKDDWIALKRPENGRSCASTLFITTQSLDSFSIVDDKMVAGLLIDRVIERIPVAERDTAVALELESPNAEAPQVMALSLNPDGGPWTNDKAFAAINNMFDWALCRPVDSVDLPMFDQHLSAILGGSSLFDKAEAPPT